MSSDESKVAQPKKRILLFDVDGTLTIPRQRINESFREYLQTVRKTCCIGIVGGSDLAKQREQLGDDCVNDFDYVFSENGLVAYKKGELIAKASLKSHLGEEKIKKFVNFTLRMIADLDIPIKRGTFIEFRDGMFNVSPIGRNCSQEERDEFEQYDKIHNVRKQMVEKLRNEFAEYKLTFSIGGQISFDVFPQGWDKTYCLQFLKADGFNDIHFFGDKTYEGGNDYEIYVHPDTKGYAVTSPDDTRNFIEKILAQEE